MQKNKYWLLTCFGISIFFLLFLSVSNYFLLIKPVYNSSNYKLDNNIDKIIIGASHSACLFDEKKIENSAVVAQSGEPIFFTYYKLKHLLEQNKGIKKVILTLSENSISKYQDHKVVMGKNGSRDALFKYFFLLDQNGKKYLNWFSGDVLLANLKYCFGVPLSYMRDLKVFVKYYSKKLNYFDFDFAGGSESNGTDVHLEDSLIVDKINMYFYNDSNEFESSKIAIDHIYKILQLCKDSSIELFIVKPPHHEKFINQIPEYYKQEYDELIAQVKLKHSEIYYADYMNLTMPDNYYLDGDHTNKFGKTYFSEIFTKDFLAWL